MKSKWVAYLRGSVRIEVRGSRQHELLNELMTVGIMVWNIKPLPDGTLQLEMIVADYLRIRPLLKQTGCRTHVIERSGLPFYWARLEKRKFFAIGILFFVLGLYLLSSLIWDVTVEGYERMDRQTVLAAAQKHGIHPFQWKFRLADPATLSKRLVQELPEASWVGVKIVGTKVHIQIVESTRPKESPLLSPRHLISTSDAVITQIIAEQGRPLVEPNKRVKKGDILISGILGDEDLQKTVIAKGTVYGLVWYEYTIEVPLQLNHRVYTGNWHTKQYAMFGKRGLQVSGYGQPEYEQQEVIEQRSMLHWRNFRIPLGWLSEKVMEVRIQEQQLTPEQAKEIGLQQAKAELILAAGEDAEVNDQKILHESSESGKVYMKVLFEVNQQITMEQPIVPEIEDEIQGE